jgi:hypothetical protein
VNDTTTATWASSNTPVATVNNSTSKGLTTAAAGGTASISATVTGFTYTYDHTLQECFEHSKTLSASSTCDVQIPTSLSVVSAAVISMSYAGCPETDYGIDIAVTYQVLDQNRAAIQNAAMEPQEELLNEVVNGQSFGNPQPSWADIGPTTYPGTSKFTGGNGQFLDAPFAFCSNVAFTASDTQPISILAGGHRYTVRTNSWSYSGSSPGHGTITNGVDISKSR